MKVLITADPLLPVPPRLYGGIERIISSLVDGLLARGHQVGLLSHRDSTSRGTNNLSWPKGSSSAAAHMRALRGAVRAFKPDVLHSFSRLAYLFPVLPKRRLPKLMSYQRRPTARTVRLANRAALGSLTFTGCSEHISETGRAAGGTWRTIHNFVDIDCYSFQPSVAHDAPLLFLSRVESIKGAHLAIEAARRAGRRLIIAGNHSDRDDDEGQYWQSTIVPALEDKRVEYVGPVHDVEKNQLLGSAAALIVPVQWEEPFGIVCAEALACGTPVISCPRGALPEIVRHGKDGFLEEDADGLVRAIEKISTLDRNNCRDRAEKAFSAGAIVPQYEAVYESILNT